MTPPSHAEIEELITQAESPKDRAMLMILLKISQSLTLQVESNNGLHEKIDNHVKRFDNHEQEEMNLFNQGRGMWKILAWVAGITQAIFIYGFAQHIEKNREQDYRLVNVEKWVAIHTTHHEMEEAEEQRRKAAK